MKYNAIKCAALLSLVCGLAACSSTHRQQAQAASSSFIDPARCLMDGYMPRWSDTKFYEAEACASGVLPKGRSYHDAVADAKRGDRRALEEVISCTYSPLCDAACGELHAGVMERLLLARGDIEFSKAVAAVMARHNGKFPVNGLLMSKEMMRRFFPLTAEVIYGPEKTADGQGVPA